MRISTDFWQALFILALCCIAGYLTHNLSAGGIETELGPAFFPWLMVVGIAFFAMLLLVRSLWRRNAAEGEGAGRANWILLCKLGLFLLYMALYAAFYVQVGYLISTGIFFVLAMLTLGERRPLHFLVVPVCITVGVYLVFTKVMNVYIP